MRSTRLGKTEVYNEETATSPKFVAPSRLFSSLTPENQSETTKKQIRILG